MQVQRQLEKKSNYWGWVYSEVAKAAHKETPKNLMEQLEMLIG